MYYINSTPTANGNYGNPQSTAFDGAYGLPDELLSAYIATMGFAALTVDGGTVTAVERNEEAYNAYIETHPPGPEPGPSPEPTPQEDYNAALMALLTGTEVTEG